MLTLNLDLPNLPGAACVGAPPELWHPAPRDVTEYTPTAKAICGTCPVRQACLDHAMSAEAAHPTDRHGIYGGMTAEQRTDLGRPPADTCRNGHPRTDENTTIVASTGRRRCRDCDNAASRARYQPTERTTTYQRSTTCRNGHTKTGDNLLVRPSDGAHICRTCKKANARANRERARAREETAA